MKRWHAGLIAFSLAASSCGSDRAPAAKGHVASHAPRDASMPPMPVDAGAAPAATIDAGAAAPSTAMRPTRLMLSFTTVPNGGKYTPYNVGAAWVADAQNKWVHTFELWGSSFLPVIKVYGSAGGPYYQLIFGGPTTPPPDVITSATLRHHGAHTGETWDFKDASGVEVPDGNYSVVIEIAESNTEQVHVFPFPKNGEPALWTGVDGDGLQDVTISLE